MKKYLLIFAILLGTVCSWGQNTNDMTVILQKCIDLPDLQQYIPLDNNAKPDGLYINYWAPTLFSTDLTVTKNGEILTFLPMSQMSSTIENAFFLFKMTEITPSFAIVIFEYTYDYKTQPKVLEVKLTMQKTNDIWDVSDTQISRKK
jgi:hypothetical protein